MFQINIPALLCALSVTSYWLTVFIKSILITKKIGKTPNIIPKELTGLLSRLIMLPLILMWIVFPWLAIDSTAFFSEVIAIVGALCCLVALGLSFYCWYYMGTAWRIGIDPKEKNQLITDGPFKQIRHPIYALSMLLMLGSLLAIQTQGMLVLFIVHWLLFSFEACREERYLLKVHGDAYHHYIKQTNRFLPKLG